MNYKTFLTVEQLKKLMIEINPKNTTQNEKIEELTELDFDEYLLTDLFEIIPGPYQNEIKTDDKCSVIGITKSNNGHVGEINTYEYPGGPYILIKCGNSGFIYKQNQPFTANTDSIIVLKAKPKLTLFNKFMNLQLITLQLNKQFGYNKLTLEEFKNTAVLITINSKFDIDLGIFDNNSTSRELIPLIKLDEDENDSEICINYKNKYIILMMFALLFIIIGQFLSK